MNKAHMIRSQIRNAFLGALLCVAGTAWGSTGACLNTSGQTVSGCSAVDVAFSSFMIPVNNDFSAPVVNTNYLYNPTLADQGGTGWVFTSSGVAGGGSNDSGALIYGSEWYSTAPPAGTQAAGLQQFAGSTTAASISQDVSGFTIGSDYAVTFNIDDRSAPCTCAAADEPGAPIEVLLGGQILGTFTPTSNTWTPVTTGMMTATSTSMTLSYSPGAGTISSSEIDSLLTDVMIGDPSDAPEPATLGLIAGGLALLAGLRRVMTAGNSGPQRMVDS